MRFEVNKLRLFLVYSILMILTFISEFETQLLISLITTLYLLVVGFKNITARISAFYLAVIGFAFLGFFDIYKFVYIFRKFQRAEINNSHKEAVYWIFISFFLFLIGYFIFSRLSLKKYTNKENKISLNKINLIVLPISLAINIIWLILYEAIGRSPYLLLLSFIPKSACVISFYMLLKRKKIIYLIYFLIFISLGFNEVSRRVYITLSFILVPLFMSRYVHFSGRLTSIQKGVIAIFLFGAFFFMNFLRSEEEGNWYVENNRLESTINYMVQFKAIDTYDNTAYVLKNFPERHSFYYGSTYSAIFFQFIPRSLWNEKPISFGAPLAYYKYAGKKQFSIEKWKDFGISFSPGLLGEAYANFGYLGLLVIPILFGFVTCYLDKIVVFEKLWSTPELLPLTSFYSSFILISRGDFLMATYYSILFFLFLSMAIKFAKK